MMEDNNKDKIIFETIKRKLPLIFHHVKIYDENTEQDPTITPTIPSKYLMTGKRIAVPLYKSISRMCLSVKLNK
jgi:hypothetical protein